ncbi:hypothetical protein D1007_18250 [Hordeum vulgare]|nr:hypothetical protein D1007_18250 [Hordeum vulgare]
MLVAITIMASLVAPVWSSRARCRGYASIKGVDVAAEVPDIVVGGMSSASSSQSPASTERESTTANDNARPHDPGADPAGPAQSRLSLQLDQRSLHFSVNAWVLIVALIGIIPLATRQLQLKGYRLSLLGTTCTTGYTIFALYGLPRVGNVQAVQAWCHHVTSSKDFIPFMYCLMFVTSKLHLKPPLHAPSPPLCLATRTLPALLRHAPSPSLFLLASPPPPRHRGSSGYHDVRACPSITFYAEIRSGEMRLGLDTFDTTDQATRAYDAAAWCLRRPRREMNFPEVLMQEWAQRLAPPLRLVIEEDRRENRRRERRGATGRPQ